jgi:predicted MFS family arabinose efflux permease
MNETPTTSQQSFWSILMVVALCFTGFFPAFLFIVKWVTSDFDTALEYFCTFVNGVFDE